MKLPFALRDKKEWIFVGPMGPMLPASFEELPVLAVDGGAKFVKKFDLWVGDGDSVETTPVEGKFLYRLPEDKDQSDLACALELLENDHEYIIHFWGFSGGRKDHELFVLGECFRFLNEHEESKIIFYDETGKTIFHLLGRGHWAFEHKGLFSLGTLVKTSVRLTGDCKFPIKSKTKLYALSSLGLSNVATGRVVLDNDGPVFVYYPEGK